MRIAVITSSYPRFEGDGTAPFVQSLAEAMRLSGLNLQIVAPYDISIQEQPGEKIKVNRFKYVRPLKWHILGHARSLKGDVHLRPLSIILLPLFLLSAFFCLLRVTRMQRSDIIHAHWLLPNGLVAAWVARIRKIPFIVSLHGSDIFVANKNIFFRMTARWIIKRAGGLSACSQELYDRAVDLGAGDKVKLIPWGADPEIFKPLPNNEVVRKKLGWHKKALIICSLGRMVEKKGFNRLVTAFAGLYAENKLLRLVIGGDGPVREDLSDQVRNLNLENAISLPGRIDWDMTREFLAAADIFVLPSIRDKKGNLDGLPTVLLEAMACGLPCIASDIGGVSLVIDSEVNGLMVEPDSILELRKALVSVISDPIRRRKLGDNARKDVVDRLNWTNVAGEFSKLINDRISMSTRSRLGQLYRNLSLPVLTQAKISQKALDLGCRDGSWLEKTQSGIRIGIDRFPKAAPDGVWMVKGDVNHLPFTKGAFDTIYALDLLEHVSDEGKLISEIKRVLRSKGHIMLTTPSDQIELHPRILTGVISRAWGHRIRRGFSEQALKLLLEEHFKVEIKPWCARNYRTWYLWLRFLYQFKKSLALNYLYKIVEADLRDSWGEHGFWIVEGQKEDSL
ncbi:MAG: glycosyltransferase [Anaerolineaceae bacterium]|nr:glycosyltransferase [Anaerolineaceae bacterium]